MKVGDLISLHADGGGNAYEILAVFTTRYGRVVYVFDREDGWDYTSTVYPHRSVQRSDLEGLAAREAT